MEPNEILVNWINNITFFYSFKCEISNDGKHEVNQN